MANPNDSRKYSWFKLDKEFMEGDVVDLLLTKKEGESYLFIYLMMVMRSINSDGKLFTRIGNNIIPHDQYKIQRDLKYWSIDTIRNAIEILEKVELIEFDEYNILTIVNFDLLVGSETEQTRRKRRANYNKTKKLTEIGETENEDIKVVETTPNMVVENTARDKSRDIRYKTKEIKEDENDEYDKSIFENPENAKNGLSRPIKTLIKNNIITEDSPLIPDFKELFDKYSSKLKPSNLNEIVSYICNFAYGNNIDDPVAYFNKAIERNINDLAKRKQVMNEWKGENKL